MQENYPKIYLYKRIVQAKLFIDAHFSESIDLENIADEACFSRFHFIRLFKQFYGSTPHQYLTKVRIENARRKLHSGQTISSVCFEVGFESITSFTSLFKRYRGLTPSQYQLAYQERQKQMKAMPLQFIPACFAENKGWLQKSNFEEVC